MSATSWLGPPSRTKSENCSERFTGRPKPTPGDGSTRSTTRSTAGTSWSGRGSWCAPIAARPASTKQTIADVEEYGVAKLLDELAADLKDGRWRPLPGAPGVHPEARQREELGRLGIPTVTSYPKAFVQRKDLGLLVVRHPFHPLFGERLEVLYVRRFPTGRVYVCDGGGGRNVALDEEGRPIAARSLPSGPLSFEVLVEGVAVVAS